MSSPICHRYEFVLLFDISNGNPNGDPDAGNTPRIDPETGHGLVSDVCLKRKIRNYVYLANLTDGHPATGYDIYVKERAVLNNQNMRAYAANNFDRNAKGRQKAAQVSEARQWMCKTFFDVRMFGAVMSTEINCGQVRGPVQIAFARSIDPIAPLEQVLTRVAVTRQSDEDKERTFGRKQIVPYALYRAHGFISPYLAADTGFSDADLNILWEALQMMFDHDRSAARGEMASRTLIVFEHERALGCAPAHRLFERIRVKRRDTSIPARGYSDYAVEIERADLPRGVTIDVFF